MHAPRDITQHDFNPVVLTKSIDLCILILGSHGPPKPISYRILVFHSLCQTIRMGPIIKGYLPMSHEAEYQTTVNHILS